MKKTAWLAGLLALFAWNAVAQEAPAPVAEASASPKITYKIGGYAQFDYRANGKDHAGTDGFKIRRARISVKGTIDDIWGYRVYIDPARDTGLLQEAWLEYNRIPEAKVKIGQYKAPFSLEALTSSDAIDFIEAPTAWDKIAPYEDVGATLSGKFLGGMFTYSVGKFNAQGKNADDTDDNGDGVGRVTVAPVDWMEFGANYMAGLRKNTILDDQKAGTKTVVKTELKTAMGTKFLAFGDGTKTKVVTVGEDLTRQGVDVAVAMGPFLVKAEQISATYGGVTDGTAKTDVTLTSQYATLSVMLTGEERKLGRPVQPASRFDENGWGAWELGVRSESFKTNQEAFDKTLVQGVRQVNGTTVGLTMWANSNVKVMLNYINNTFSEVPLSAVGSDITKKTETGTYGRFQLSY